MITSDKTVYGRENLEKATFAGGCFWCMDHSFRGLNGVKEVISGYTGGTGKNPAYEEVSSGRTGHLEAVEVLFDPSTISYDKLVNVFWRSIDPTDEGGQFADRGSQYKTAIFYHSAEQKQIAETSKKKLGSSGRFKKPVATKILPAAPFYRAENYHQDYAGKNPLRYKRYSEGSGREQFIRQNWKDEQGKQTKGKSAYSKPSDQELKKRLTPLQYKVVRENHTETAFNNQYWSNKKEGIYVDIATGEPLFSSLDKYDSDSGWPSFKKPLDQLNIIEKTDTGGFMIRTEVRSRSGDSHLGHVFDDGPAPEGKRYCINSASLRFIPKEDLEKEGYGEHMKLFAK